MLTDGENYIDYMYIDKGQMYVLNLEGVIFN